MPRSTPHPSPGQPKDFAALLSGGDLRSLGRAGDIRPAVRDPAAFDRLFACLEHPDRRVVMRAADAVEKITRDRPEWLAGHAAWILDRAETAEDKELQWHLAQLLPRLPSDGGGAGARSRKARALKVLKRWAVDPQASRIVRVNALQALWDLASRAEASSTARRDLAEAIKAIEKEAIPSLQARLRRLKAASPGGRNAPA